MKDTDNVSETQSHGVSIEWKTLAINVMKDLGFFLTKFPDFKSCI